MVCDVDEDLVKKLRQFRFRKETNNAAIVSEYQQHILILCLVNLLILSSRSTKNRCDDGRTIVIVLD